MVFLQRDAICISAASGSVERRLSIRPSVMFVYSGVVLFKVPTLAPAVAATRVYVVSADLAVFVGIFSQPSIYIDGWLYAMSMTSVVCNVPVLSQNDSTYHHSVFTT